MAVKRLSGFYPTHLIFSWQTIEDNDRKVRDDSIYVTKIASSRMGAKRYIAGIATYIVLAPPSTFKPSCRQVCGSIHGLYLVHTFKHSKFIQPDW